MYASLLWNAILVVVGEPLAEIDTGSNAPTIACFRPNEPIPVPSDEIATILVATVHATETFGVKSTLTFDPSIYGKNVPNPA